MKVCILFLKPYTEVFSYANKDNIKFHVLEGYDANVFFMILDNMDMKAEYIIQNLNMSTEEKVSKVIGELILLSDVGFGALSMHHLASPLFDFTCQFADSMYKWYVPGPKQVTRLERILKIFSVPLWILWIMLLILASIYFWVITQGYRALKLKQNDHLGYTDKLICFSYILSISLGVAVWKTPSSNAFRSFFIAWIWYSFAVRIVFQTFFTTFLVNPGYQKSMKTINELFESSTDLGYDELLYYITNDTFTNNIHWKRKTQKSCSINDDCFPRYLQGEFATMSTDFEAKYSMILLGKNKPVCFLEENILSKRSTIYLGKGTPYLDRFNEIIIKM